MNDIQPYWGLRALRLRARMAVFGAKVLWAGRESVTERYLQCGAMIDVQGHSCRTHGCTAPDRRGRTTLFMKPVLVET
ncbi:unnamed protein product [Arctogadus glacialis]